MKKILLSLIVSFLAFAAYAQIQEPVKFKTELKNVSATEVEIVFIASIEQGWHVYSTDLGDGGPISATFNTDKLTGAQLDGKLRPIGKEIASFDKLFEMDVRYFEHTTTRTACLRRRWSSVSPVRPRELLLQCRRRLRRNKQTRLLLLPLSAVPTVLLPWWFPTTICGAPLSTN